MPLTVLLGCLGLLIPPGGVPRSGVQLRHCIWVKGWVGGWLRAFINPISFLIDSALTFESITTACASPACYRPILPAGLAYQVIFKTNNTASL